MIARKQIFAEMIDAGDRSAGLIRRISIPKEPKGTSKYAMAINRNHTAPIQFVTIAHELAHLFLSWTFGIRSESSHSRSSRPDESAG
jgi:hypothetical protein